MPDAPAALPAPLAELLRAHPRACVILYGRHPALSGVCWLVEEGDDYTATVQGEGARELPYLCASAPTPEAAFAAVVERVRVLLDRGEVSP